MTEDGRELTAFPGTRAEFLAPKGSVPGLWPDESQPERWCSQFLDNGAKLRIALTVRNPSWLSSDLTDKILLSPRSVWGQIEWSAIDGRYSTNSHFIEVGLGEPNERQKEKLPGFTGGLLINMRGEDILSIDPSSLQLPEALADLHANSLNRLLTLLSEKYETHRASHTASIYQKVFYQEWDERWYPLGFLKQSVEGAPRESLAEKFWSANAPVDDDQAESE